MAFCKSSIAQAPHLRHGPAVRSRPDTSRWAASTGRSAPCRRHRWRIVNPARRIDTWTARSQFSRCGRNTACIRTPSPWPCVTSASRRSGAGRICMRPTCPGSVALQAAARRRGASIGRTTGLFPFSSYMELERLCTTSSYIYVLTRISHKLSGTMYVLFHAYMGFYTVTKRMSVQTRT